MCVCVWRGGVIGPTLTWGTMVHRVCTRRGRPCYASSTVDTNVPNTWTAIDDYYYAAARWRLFLNHLIILGRYKSKLYSNALSNKQYVLMMQGWAGIDWWRASEFNCVNFGGRNTDESTCERTLCTDKELMEVAKGIFYVGDNTVPDVEGTTISGKTVKAIVNETEAYWAKHDIAPRSYVYVSMHLNDRTIVNITQRSLRTV